MGTVHDYGFKLIFTYELIPNDKQRLLIHRDSPHFATLLLVKHVKIIMDLLRQIRIFDEM